MAFRAGSIAYLLRKLKGAIGGGRGGATAGKPNVKIELDISACHRKDVVRVTAHPDNYPLVKKLMAAAQPEKLGFIGHLVQLNLAFATGELAVKARRVFLKAKESGVNEAAKGILNSEMEQLLQCLVREVKENTEKIKYLTEAVEHDKHAKGVPPPPARPPAPPKEGANGKSGKSEGNGGKSEGNGGKSEGNGGRANGDPPARPPAPPKEGANGKSEGNGGGTNGVGGDTLEPVDFYGGF